MSPRPWCQRCRRARGACYCPIIKPFTPDVRFVILIHPDELRRPIATGRMTHLCLANSLLIDGVDFSDHALVNAIIDDPAHHCVVLFPAPTAMRLGSIGAESPATVFAPAKIPVVFLLDGTWQHARKMLRLSPNLGRLPTIALSPTTPSEFRNVRKQPRPGCLSTIEATHAILDWFHATSDTPNGKRPHDNLLEAFRFMVRTQEHAETKPVPENKYFS